MGNNKKINYNDFVGQKFNKLTIISVAQSKKVSGQMQNRLICKCECGKEKELAAFGVIKGIIKACGCLRNKEQFRENSTIHGLRFDPLYNIWRGIKARCRNEKCPNYIGYGSRGISMCDEWANSPKMFILWAKENGYKKGLQIDRKENNGNYEPSNCRFVTPIVNSNNRRSTKKFLYNGEIKTLSELSKTYGINIGSFHNRLRRGWAVEKIISTPIETKYINTKHKQKQPTK